VVYYAPCISEKWYTRTVKMPCRVRLLGKTEQERIRRIRCDGTRQPSVDRRA
jgi:hypothetical protein